MDRQELIRTLAAMTEVEYRDLALEARGVDDNDIRSIITRELTRAPALNSDAIAHDALDR